MTFPTVDSLLLLKRIDVGLRASLVEGRGEMIVVSRMSVPNAQLFFCDDTIDN